VPPPVENLLAVAAFRARAKEHGITDVTLQGNAIRFTPMKLRESQVLRLKRLYPGAVHKQALDVVLVPHPKTAPFGGQPLRDAALLAWATDLLTAVLDPPPPA
jgi:transcription-repair coupling factor (superfamily II helicase)